MPKDCRAGRQHVRLLPAIGLLAALLLSALSFLATAQTADTGALPAPVAQALREPSCNALLTLLDRYRDQPDAETTVAALKRGMLLQPNCGTVSGKLVQVTPVEGANFFDHRQVLGVPPGEPGPPVIGPGYHATYSGRWHVIQPGTDLTCAGFYDLSGRLRLPDQVEVAFTRGSIRLDGPGPLPTLTGRMHDNRFELRTTRTDCPAGSAHFVATGTFEPLQGGGIALSVELRVTERGKPTAVYHYNGRGR